MQITDLQMVHKQLNNSYIPQYVVVVNMQLLIYCAFPTVKKANTHYLRIKCVLQAHHENNAYCVRIKSVLFSQNRFTESVQEKRTLGEIMSGGGRIVAATACLIQSPAPDWRKDLK